MIKNQKLFAGIDIGSLTSKTVIFDGVRILASSILPTGSFPRKSGELSLASATQQIGITPDTILLKVATGYGRKLVMGTRPVTEISCFAKGARFLEPATEMIIDIGGQDSKIILLDESGATIDFLTNDKCAAGTGRFLETAARALNMQVDEMALLGRDVEPLCISNTCGVFAESEIVGLLAAELPIERIVAGIHQSVADRTIALVNRIGARNHIMFCGGVSRNDGIRSALEQALGRRVFVPAEPQIVGALGAAIIAAGEYEKTRPDFSELVSVQN